MSLESKPIFSIIIPTYNSESTLDLALSSIVNQYYKNIEVLIVDGLSTDNTVQIAKKYQKNFSNISIKSSADKGIYDAMNKGIEFVNGEWIYFMGSDDTLYNNEVIKQVSEIIGLGTIDVVYGNITSSRFGGIYDGEFSATKILNKNICHQAIFINRRVFDTIGNFNLKFKSHADWDHNIRWFFSSSISKKFVDLVIANYADGGFSSLNYDLLFEEHLKKIFPLVSICIPTYNGSAFIAESLESAILQTYPNLEIVVSDDASKDDTLSIVEAFKDKTDIPISIYHHQPNGIGANWNYCIEKAKGEYIKFLFQDDVLLPTCIEKMLTFIESDSRIGMVACKREFIIENRMNTKETQKWISEYDDLQRELPFKPFNEVIVLDKKLFKSDVFFRRPLNKIGEPSTYMFKKDIVDTIGFFREDLKQILDYEFCYRLLKTHKIAILNEKLCRFRIHSLQATQTNKGKDSSDYEVYYRLINKDYFWYLNAKRKVGILRSRFFIIDYFFRLKGKLKR